MRTPLLLIGLLLALPAHALVIMPMGDSITVGYAEPGASYRYEMAYADPTINFVGDYYKASFPHVFDGDHQAVGGYSIQQMTAEYGPAVAAHDPDVVLLLAGTNNHWTGATVQDYIDLFSVVGSRRIIAATVPKFGYNRVPETAYWTDAWVDNRNSAVIPAINDALREAVSLTPDASLVDFYTALDPLSDLVSDAVHPNVSGQTKLAGLFTSELHRMPGDLDGDNDVDGADISGFFVHFTGPTPSMKLPTEGNLDGDGDVDGADIAIAFSLFAGPSSPVPEPGIGLVYLLALLNISRARP